MPSKRIPLFNSSQIIPGLRIGRMVVVGKSAVLAKAGYLWDCKCDCGKEFLANRGSIARGDYQSCGCYRVECKQVHGRCHTPEYRAWADMIDRCTNPNNPRFKDYGGRGITVTPLWRHSFEVFYADLGPRPAKYQLDRLDNHGNYEPGNCHWTTAKRNARNRRTARIIEFDGRSMSVVEWAEELGIDPVVIRSRLALGWSVRDIVTLPSTYANRRLRRIAKMEDEHQIEGESGDE